MIGQFIRTRREALDLSLAELAERLTDRGYLVQRQTVNHCELNRNNAPIESEKFREALASALEIDVNEMLQEIGFALSNDSYSSQALYLAELLDQLPEDERDLLIDYAQMIEKRYLKKTAEVG